MIRIDHADEARAILQHPAIDPNTVAEVLVVAEVHALLAIEQRLDDLRITVDRRLDEIRDALVRR